VDYAIPMIMLVMNVAYAVTFYLAGTLADRMDRRRLVAIGFIVFILADLVFATATNIGWVMLGVMPWGLHMDLTRGMLSALAADTAPIRPRATAFGVFNLVSGMAPPIASLFAGLVWACCVGHFNWLWR